MLYDSPLNTLAGEIIFVLIMLAVFCFAINTWINWLTPLGAFLLAAITHDLQDTFGGLFISLAVTYVLLLLQRVDVLKLDKAAIQSQSLPKA